MSINARIRLSTQKPANKEAELKLKDEFVQHVQEKIFEIGKFKDRICFDILNSELQRFGKFDLSGIEEEIFGFKNGKLGRLTAARKKDCENAMFDALKQVVNPIIDYIESFYDYADIVGSDSKKQRALEWAMGDIMHFKLDLVETDFEIKKLIFEKVDTHTIERLKNYRESILSNLASSLMSSDKVLNPTRVGTQTIGEIIKTRILQEEFPQQFSYEIESETEKKDDGLTAANFQNEKTLSKFEANCNAIEYGIGHARSGRISKACSQAAEQIIDWESLPKAEQDKRIFEGQIDTCSAVIENKFSSNDIQKLAADTLKMIQSAKTADGRDSLIDDMLDQYYHSILDNPSLIQSQSKNGTFKYSIVIDSKKINVPTEDIRRLSIALDRFDDCGIYSYMKKSFNQLLHYSFKHRIKKEQDSRETFIKIRINISTITVDYESDNWQSAVNFAIDFMKNSSADVPKIELSCFNFGTFFIISEKDGITLDKTSDVKRLFNDLKTAWIHNCEEIDESDRQSENEEHEICVLDICKKVLLCCRLDSHKDLIVAKSKLKILFKNLLKKTGKMEKLNEVDSIIDKTFSDFDFSNLEQFLWTLNRGEILHPMNQSFYLNLKNETTLDKSDELATRFNKLIA